jgi:Polyketide cyclase / dehydrase and lipid transport
VLDAARVTDAGPNDQAAATDGGTELTISMWGEFGPRPEPNHDLDDLFATLTAEASVEIRCTPEAAWALVSDVERIGEFSPECVAAWWVDDRPARAVGGRFEGRNRVVAGTHASEWIRPCDVVTWDPPRTFAWTAGDRFDGTPATRWAFEIEPTSNGVVLRQTFAHLPDGLSGIRGMAEADPDTAPAIVDARRRSLRDGVSETLTRMREVLDDSTN